MKRLWKCIFAFVSIAVPSNAFCQTISGSTYNLVGASGSWTAGPSTPTAGSIAQVDWDWKRGSTDISSVGGFFGDKVYVGQGVARTFTSADSGTGNAGSATSWSLAVNDGSPQQITSQMSWAWAKQSNSIIFGSNIVATTDPGLTNVQATGLEIDIQPASGTTLNGASNGLVVNTWSTSNPASAISVNRAGGGTWAVGLQCAAGSVLGGCVAFPNGTAGGAVFGGSGNNPAAIYNAGDYLTLNEGANGFAIKAQNGFTNHVVLSNVGTLQLTQYGAGVLTTDSSGNLTAGNAPSYLGGNNAAIAIPANTTTYIYNCAHTTFGLCAAVAPKAATIKNLYVTTNVPPGTGQQYIITFSTNIGATALSCSISGSAKSCNDAVNSASLLPGQQYTIKFVSSSSAAPTNMTWGAELDAH